MSWAKLDDRYPRHRKVRPLSDAAFRLDVSAFCFAAEYLTDGRISAEDLPQVADIRNPRRAADELVRRRRWHTAGHDCPRCPPADDGWVIHDYLSYNDSRDKVLHAQHAKAERQRRWYESRHGRVTDASESNASDATLDDPDTSTDTVTDDATDAPVDEPSHDARSSADASLDASTDAPATVSATPSPSPSPSQRATPPAGRSRAAPREPPTAQSLIAGWIDACDKRPPQRVIGQVAREVARMLGEGIDSADLERGLTAWAAKGLHPSVLASVVNEVMNAAPPHPAGGPRSRNAAILDAARERAHRAEHRPEGGPR